jgi:hypothetical protein
MNLGTRYRDVRVTRRTTVGELGEAIDVEEGVPVRIWRVLRFDSFHEAFRRSIEELLDHWQGLPPFPFLRPVGRFREGKDLFVVFEAGRLQSLDQFFFHVPLWPWPLACRVLEQVLRGLQEFYHRWDERGRREASHGRLGLSTIFLDEAGQVRIVPPVVTPAYGAAYGFACPWETDPLSRFLGDAEGDAPGGRLWDTYSLGVTAYFLLAGRWPWVSDEAGQPVWTLRVPLRAVVPWLPDELDAWVRSLLEPSPPDLGALARALNRLYRQAGLEADGPHLQEFFRDPQAYYAAYRRRVEDQIREWRFRALRDRDEEAALWFHEVLQRFDPWVAQGLAQGSWVEERRARVALRFRGDSEASRGLEPWTSFGLGGPSSLREKPSAAFPRWRLEMESALVQGRLLEAWTAWKRLEWNRAPVVGAAVDFLADLDARLQALMTRSEAGAVPEVPAAEKTVPDRPTRTNRRRRRAWVAAGLTGMLIGGALLYGGARVFHPPASPSETPLPGVTQAPENLAVPAVPLTCPKTPSQVQALRQQAETAEERQAWVQACDARIQVLACMAPDDPDYAQAWAQAEAVCRKARRVSPL